LPHVSRTRVAGPRQKNDESDFPKRGRRVAFPKIGDLSPSCPRPTPPVPHGPPVSLAEHQLLHRSPCTHCSPVRRVSHKHASCMAESGHDDGDDRRRPLMLVTGCSEGSIGHAVVHAFVAARCSVIATARSYASMRGFRGCLLLLVLLSLLLRCRQCNMCVISCEF
jgi:hypothetical protein